LNERIYDAKVFEKQGIKVFDLEFPDGTCPSEQILNKFIEIMKHYDYRNQGVAVHCRAGLGRTGTIIGCYMA
jgi:cell division cycle 14